jgi:hypothetical protein
VHAPQYRQPMTGRTGVGPSSRTASRPEGLLPQ